MRNVIFLSVLAAVSSLAQTKTAGETFKNITHLKDIPADQLLPAMQVMSTALGVECSFCHVQGKMDADDNNHKKIAREMITMMASLNKNNFGGRPLMSCYGCHHGSAHPVTTPPVVSVEEARKPKDPGPPAASTLTADQIIEKYVAALGGADAIRKIESRVMKGSTHVGEVETPIEVYTKAPNKRVSITRSKDGSGSFTAFDGKGGWMGNTGRPARDMAPGEAMSAGLDAEFYLPLRLKELYPQLRKGQPERVNGFECETLIGNASPGHPAVRLYFDRQTGLLLRLVRMVDTPAGRNPTQVDYGDFRELDGVTIPYHWALARPNGRFMVQIAEIKSNVPIEDSQFAKPSGNVPK
jgi:photosynthetic reaction center cytochrome c subunit